jgi:hypothetical protein
VSQPLNGCRPALKCLVKTLLKAQVNILKGEESLPGDFGSSLINSGEFKGKVSRLVNRPGKLSLAKISSPYSWVKYNEADLDVFCMGPNADPTFQNVLIRVLG